MDTGETPKGGIFVYREMLQSEAFLCLNKSGMIVLLALLNKRDGRYVKSSRGSRKEFQFFNLDSIELTYKEAKQKWGLNQQTTSAGFTQLLQHGFIRVVRAGGTGSRDKAVYALIDDWKQWKPGTVFRNREPDVKRGYQGKGLGAVNKNLRT